MKARHPLYCSFSLGSVSITHLSNRLFLEFRFYNPYTAILPAPVDQTHTLPSFPKYVSISRMYDRVIKCHKLCTLSSWQAFRRGNDDNFQEGQGGVRMATDKACLFSILIHTQTLRWPDLERKKMKDVS